MASEKRGKARFAAPTSSLERVTELDVLRGVALLGVFLMSLPRFAGPGFMATPAQIMALPTFEVDSWTSFVAVWLVLDKANTLFAFLFGLGFYIQMERAEAKGVPFERLYLRRLTILLLIGLAHLLLLWAWDILHLYALAGFALFAFRHLSTRALIVTGVALALVPRIIYEALLRYGVLGHGWATFYSDEAVLHRQAVSTAGDYGALVQIFANYTLFEYFLNGLILAWLLYALGRFLVGAWVGRHGWLQRPVDNLSGFRRIMLLTLPSGLLLALIAAFMLHHNFEAVRGSWAHWPIVGTAVRLIAAPVLATGYLCAIIVALHNPLGRQLFAPFRHVGRMALTNYVGQSLIIGFVVFGVGPGLDLAGRIGWAASWAIVVVAFVLQLLLSKAWLATFNFGPLEYLWRGLTYSSWPAMLRSSVPGPIART